MKSLQRFASSFLFALLACVATAQVSAEPVVTSAFRAVFASTRFPDFPIGSASFATGSFSEGVVINETNRAGAFQDSLVGGAHVEGGGIVHAIVNTNGDQGDPTGHDGADARSTYEVSFDLDYTHFFNLIVGLTEVLFVDGGEAEVSAAFQLTGPGTNLIFEAQTNVLDQNFFFSGFLGPGSYHLEFVATAHGAPGSDMLGEASWFFGLDVVPEPATLALLGIALAGLGFGRRKQFVLLR